MTTLAHREAPRSPSGPPAPVRAAAGVAPAAGAVRAGGGAPAAELGRFDVEDVFTGTEQLVLCHDRQTGLRAAIAIDDTTLGPALGGVRWMAYPDEATAVGEARRLARVMTLKNAAAGLPYGGGKSVLVKGEERASRHEVMRAFGRFVARLNGVYLPGVDMGTSVSDLRDMAAVAPGVAAEAEDPSPSTAVGVLCGIEAAVRVVDGVGVEGKTVLVQGVGHVGRPLARLLVERGADVVVADADPRRAVAVAGALNETRLGSARMVEATSVVGQPCDVFAPCATARVVTMDNVSSLRCRIIAGGANDVLAARACGEALAEAGVVYVPDFVINAGGVIAIHGARTGQGDEWTRSAVAGIGDRVRAVLTRSAEGAGTPLQVAEDLASARLGRPVRIPD